ncbi:protein PIGBOS1-like [Porphyrio hochstetteri]
MWGRLPLPQVALAVALGVASGLYIYRPVFRPPEAPQPHGGTAGPTEDAVSEKRP